MIDRVLPKKRYYTLIKKFLEHSQSNNEVLYIEITREEFSSLLKDSTEFNIKADKFLSNLNFNINNAFDYPYYWMNNPYSITVNHIVDDYYLVHDYNDYSCYKCDSLDGLRQLFDVILKDKLNESLFWETDFGINHDDGYDDLADPVERNSRRLRDAISIIDDFSKLLGCENEVELYPNDDDLIYALGLTFLKGSKHVYGNLHFKLDDYYHINLYVFGLLANGEYNQVEDIYYECDTLDGVRLLFKEKEGLFRKYLN